MRLTLHCSEFYPRSFPTEASYQFVDYTINFVSTLDPNGNALTKPNANLIRWPQYTSTVPFMLTWLDRPLGDQLTGLTSGLDFYREAAMKTLIAFARKYAALG